MRCSPKRHENPIARPASALHNSVTLQDFEFVGANSKRPEYFGVMLTERRWPPHRTARVRRVGKFDRRTGHLDRSSRRIVAVDQGPTLTDLGIGDHFLHS